MKNTCALILLLFTFQGLLAQEQTVRGRITSQHSQIPLAGVRVLVTETGASTVSDREGLYQITVPDSAAITFSYSGFLTRTLVPGENSTAEVELALSDPVAIGYSISNRETLTSAIASVKATEVPQEIITSPELMMQGRLAGVQVSMASGEPGAAASTRIRGVSSIEGGNPLFVVDGVPLTEFGIVAGSLDLGLGIAPDRNSLNTINPSDIERIDVLKDAAATAIYGVRGANGVVLITTKNGSGKSHSVDYSSALSVSRMANKLALLDREQFLDGAESLGADRASLDFGATTDWQDQISRTAFSHRHHLAYGHQHATGHYRASLGYEQLEGIIKNTALERITGRVTLNQVLVKDKLNLGAHLSIGKVNDLAAPITDSDGAYGGLMGSAYLANPTWPADPSQQLNTRVANPLSILAYTQDRTSTNRQLANAWLSYTIRQGLQLTATVGYDYATSQRAGAYSPELIIFDDTYKNKGRGSLQELETRSNLIEAMLRYDKNFETSALNAVVGYSNQQFSRNSQNLSAWGFTSTDPGAMLNDMEQAAATLRQFISSPYDQFGYSQNSLFYTINSPQPRTFVKDNAPALSLRSLAESHAGEKNRLESLFGRLTYSLKERYYFTGTLRADGSTRFATKNRYGLFPALAFAWRLSNEPFVPAMFDELKLRFSWGISGNQQVLHQSYQSRKQYSTTFINPDGSLTSPVLTTLGFDNPDFRAEQTSQINAGLDAGFFGGRLWGSINIYRKRTTNTVLTLTPPQPSPQETIQQNVAAELINIGQEIALHWSAIASEQASLTFSLQASHTTNTVKGLQESYDRGLLYGQGLSGVFVQQLANEQPLHTYVLREFEGYDENGFSVYKNDFPKSSGKSALPNYGAGFGANLRYKHWELATHLYGQFGHYLYNNTANAHFTKGTLLSARNITEAALNSAENSANAPDPSTRFLEKGDFLRMQYLRLAYNLNFDKRFIKGLSLSATGQNLFVLTNYTGPDPEFAGSTAPGIDYTSYPRAKTFTLSLSALF